MRQALWLVIVLFLAAGLAWAAGEPEVEVEGFTGEVVQDEIEIWWHEGVEAEVHVIEDFVEEFNQTQDEVTAELTLVPEADYAEALRGASAADALPDVIDTDASFAFAYAWGGDLQPLDPGMDDELLDDLLPSIVNQGTYADRIWAVGMFESGQGIYADRSALEEIGARIPEHPEEAWTVEEFNQILDDLRDIGYERPLDMKQNYGYGEHYSYLFSPIVWSSGARLISEDFSQADGYLNSPEAVEAMTHFQDWFLEDYVDPNEDDAAFIEGRSALSWVGHWEYDRYKDALGDDLVVLPNPDFGEGSVAGQGSWQWTINAESDADAAWKFIEYTLEPEQMERIADAAGALPARSSVARDHDLWGPGGDLELFRIQLEEGYTQPRPPHPVYDSVSPAFNSAVHDIIDGADVESALTSAAEEIDSDIDFHEGYPEPDVAD